MFDELFALLDALDTVMDAERLSRRALEWDEAVARPRKAIYPRSDVESDLWGRHRPAKNTYVIRNGRRCVGARVFIRRDVARDCDNWCHYCLCDSIVCRVHEFQLIDRDAIRRYVDNAMYYDLWQ